MLDPDAWEDREGFRLDCETFIDSVSRSGIDLKINITFSWLAILTKGGTTCIEK